MDFQFLGFGFVLRETTRKKEEKSETIFCNSLWTGQSSIWVWHMVPNLSYRLRWRYNLRFLFKNISLITVASIEILKFESTKCARALFIGAEQKN